MFKQIRYKMYIGPHLLSTQELVCRPTSYISTLQVTNIEIMYIFKTWNMFF